MAAFTPASFSCESEDKGFGYSAQVLEEPFGEFFEHELTHTISSLGRDGRATNDFDFPDIFTDGETTSSASYVTDSTSSASSQPRFKISRDRNRSEDTLSLPKTAFLPQNYLSRGRREKLQPAVSGLELLLDIEGQATSRHHSSDPPHSAPPNVSTLPLRRKPRFRAVKSTGVHNRDHRASKPPTPLCNEQPKMIRPSCYFRHESPQPQEWTPSLEQLSLQPALSDFSLSTPTVMVPQCHSDLHAPRHTTLRDQFMQGERNDGHGSPHVSSGAYIGLDATFGTANIASMQVTSEGEENRFEAFNHREGNLDSEPEHQLRQYASWAPSMDASRDATYMLSTNQAATTWNHGLPESTDSYYTNINASKSAPTLPHQITAESSIENLGAMGDTLGTLFGEEPPKEHMAGLADPYTVHANPPQYPPPPMLKPSSTQGQSHAPTGRPSTPSATSPSCTRRRSKSAHRRNKSAGNLKAPKSPATMGFVNFTANDSKRILTGVAPSGSSKTKARREQEANEKKRKLSLAVLRAVEEAGGDPEPLRKEGLLIEG
ncbi:MAG: hypothetical protein Q9201_007229 [Fulgogasparrea decipioides]